MLDTLTDGGGGDIEFTASDSTIGVSLVINIEGNKIYTPDYSEEVYIFDLDFDGQHRKQFEQPEGIWLMMMPNMLLGSPSDRYAIIETAIESNLLSVYVWCNEGDTTTGYQPITADSELQDIDVADWFTDSQGDSNIANIASLIKEVLKMEYHYDGNIRVEKDPEQQTPNVDGQWNPFTDGSPYRPVAALQMTSRMPNGLPVEVSQGRRLLATFNRSLKMQELVGKLVGVFAYESPAPATVAQLSSIEVTSLYEGVWRDVDGEQAVLLNIEGTNLYVETFGANDGYIFDVDYNQQHRRALTMQASPDPLLYYINMPTLSPSILTDKICIYVYADDMNYFQLVRMPGSGELATYDGSHMPPQGIQANLQHLLGILRGILKLEFTGSQDWEIDVWELSQDTTTMVAGVNLLEVTTMPAP